MNGIFTFIMLSMLNLSVAIPEAKLVFQRMDVMFHNGARWDNWTLWLEGMGPFFEERFVYDYSYPFSKTRGLRQWFLGEHTAYNQAFAGYNSSLMISVANDSVLTCAAYHLARWSGAFAGVPAPPGMPVVRVRDLDFYVLRESKISYNWCMVDVVDILQQGGYKVLPQSPLPEDGLYPPPNAMDGIPSPNSLFVKARHTDVSMKIMRHMINADFVEQQITARWWSTHMVWYGPAGIGTARSKAQYVNHFLVMMRNSFSAPSVHIDSMVCEGLYCGVHFHLQATHTGCWLGLPATGIFVKLRFGLHARLGLERDVFLVQEAWMQLDIPAAFAQLGVDLLKRAHLESDPFPGCVSEAQHVLGTNLVETTHFGNRQAFLAAMASLLLIMTFLVHRCCGDRSLACRDDSLLFRLRQTLAE